MMIGASMDIVTITADRICIGDQIVSKQPGQHWNSVTSRTVSNGKVLVTFENGSKIELLQNSKLSVRRNQ